MFVEMFNHQINLVYSPDQKKLVWNNLLFLQSENRKKEKIVWFTIKRCNFIDILQCDTDKFNSQFQNCLTLNFDQIKF